MSLEELRNCYFVFTTTKCSKRSWPKLLYMQRGLVDLQQGGSAHMCVSGTGLTAALLARPPSFSVIHKDPLTFNLSAKVRTQPYVRQKHWSKEEAFICLWVGLLALMWAFANQQYNQSDVVNLIANIRTNALQILFSHPDYSIIQHFYGSV